MSSFVHPVVPYGRTLRHVLVALSVLAAPAVAAAQSGSISGLVSDSAKAPLPGAQVTVVGTRFSSTSGMDGRYRVVGVPAGTYSLRVQRIGALARTFDNITVAADRDTKLDITLAASALQLGGYVVSASRRVEKITDAPATVTRIDADQLRNTVGNSFTSVLKDVKGVDFFQTGVAAAGINARGFNSAFNNRMLQMEDNRVAVLPENGLPVGVFTTIPKIDIAGVEVLIGPGAALYGPDASNGVVTLLSKDPKQYKGLTVETSMGSNGGSVSKTFEKDPGHVSFSDLQVRYANVYGKVGFKVTGEALYANDWQNTNNYAPVAPRTTASPEINPDWTTSYRRASGALVYYFDQGGRLEYQAGASNSNGIGVTSAGRNQLKNWGYWNQQVRYTSDHWFAQAYATRSTSGQTFALNGFSTNRLAARFNGISDDSVRRASAFPADGHIYAGEIQYNTTVPKLFNTRIVAGSQVRRDVVSSKEVWLTDALTKEDIQLNQVGVYAQTETPVNQYAKLVFGARYDNPEFYDPQFSPKAALLLSPNENSTFRLTFNRAFKSPSILQTSFYFRDFSPSVGVFGNKDGTTIKDAAGTTLRTFAPVVPEVNNTIELGYKGVIKDRLYIDVAGYVARYKSFLSPLVVVANPFAGTFAYNTATNKKYTNAAGAEQIALTYYNLGEATLTGIDAGWRFVVNSKVNTTGTFSVLKLDSIIQKTGDPAEATSLNSPTMKATVGMDGKDGPFQTFGGFTMRFVKDYKFLSGVHNGRIPGLLNLDINMGKRLTPNMVLNVSVQNLFTCTSGVTTAPGFLRADQVAPYQRGWGCGLGRKHIELLNMPALGSMTFIGLRFDR
ncbi:TonB-dependent receptor [Gemmatimonas groenlandica]|uniref:TonB-dependent receptor n=1 Tax=Gemmatimonas groenlandica TaxID=2732249 RepID=A0A6M4IMG2_9BACT|nr:TonB-dependent receptor [Gemmatimonas groenlandica]QJR34647.1 TonB-dependent receptor [Gemmatimonas groenlandica]